VTAVGSSSEQAAATESPCRVLGDLRCPGAAGAAGPEKLITELVEATYRVHGAGDSVNPPSYFLRFPDRPSSRIIALLARSVGRCGGRVKWISSFPENVAAGIRGLRRC